MLPIVNWNECAEDFPVKSLMMAEPDTPVLRERIRRLFSGTTVEYLGTGFNNAHHSVRTDDGQGVVVRRALAPVPALQTRLRREYAVLLALKERCYPHSPHPVMEFAAGTLDACPAYAMTFVDGATWAGTAEQARALGQAASALHGLPIARLPGDCGTALAPMVIIERLCTRLRRNLHEIGPSWMAAQRARAGKLLDTLPGKLAACDWRDSRSALVHGDLGDHNVRFVDGCAVLLDWEFAALADPLFDVMWFAARDGVWEHHMPSFLSGYGDSNIAGRMEHLRLLRDLALVELALWAQSGLDDLAAGLNGHFFRPEDGTFLGRQVERLEDTTT